MYDLGVGQIGINYGIMARMCDGVMGIFYRCGYINVFGMVINR